MRLTTETRVGLFILLALGIFFYMTFHIGVFRLDTANYKPYTVYFEDVSGLEKKAAVKIAGVKVGWVESIELIQNDLKAKAHIMVLKRYELHRDAYAVVRQEGLLGNKYLEVVPGDPMLPELHSGEALTKPSKSPVSIDDLLHQVSNIASNIEDVSESFKESVGTAVGRENLKGIVENLAVAAERLAAFSDVLDRTASSNEENINTMISDFRDFAREMRENMPTLGSDLRRLTEQLETSVFPAMQNSAETIANAINRDFDRIATTLEGTSSSFAEAATEAREGLRSVGEVATKINEGKGLLGKLVNEDETYHDLKVAVQGLKNYLAKIDNLGVVFDSHGERMYRKAEHFELKDAKGYLDIRIHPSEDRFYVLQLVGTTKGSIERYVENHSYFDECGCFIERNDPIAGVTQTEPFAVEVRQPPRHLVEIQHRDTIKYGAQFGKIFGDFAVRGGLFENTFGIAVDYDIPFRDRDLRWVTSLEIFDWQGRDRLQGPIQEFDDRPHFKWINRVFYMNNIYMAFGADDFISKENASAFFGAGLRFEDDDIKYLASRVSWGK